MYLVKRFTQLNLWNKLNVLGVIVTVFSAGFSILVFMSATENVMQPRYAVDWHESLFTQRDDLPDLRINWRGKEYTNLFVAHVALWNQGGKAIDKSSISTTNPPRILCPAFVSVLSAELVKTSRQSLKMALRETQQDERPVVQVEILGDDALEHLDGCLVRLVYSKTPGSYFGRIRGDLHTRGPVSGSGPDDFIVTGRIKGSGSDFALLSWEYATHSSTPPLVRWAFGIFMVTFVAFGILPFVRVFFSPPSVSNEPARPAPAIVKAIALLCFVAVVFSTAYYFIATNFGGPTWIR